MSKMRCEGCDNIVDVDDDPDSLYILPPLQGRCFCEWCRDEQGLKTYFDEAGS